MTEDQGAAPADAAPRVAVVGVAGRFPGAPDVATLWSNLCAGVESIRVFSREELLAVGVPAARLDDPLFVPARGVLDDVESFDAAFFELVPREASLLDPQQRLFLECAWHALEDAGCDPARAGGPVGVFAGLSESSYALSHLAELRRDPHSAAAVVMGNDRDFFATRVSYELGLTGPSLTLQTACSTSLVAIHQAAQALLTWQCRVALAGGATVKLPQVTGHLYQEGGIFSPDGHCRAFDAQARGTVGGSGVGVVVLKRLEDALADGDRIYAVLLGSAVNNDGAAKIGYTAPGLDGQADVIATAQAVAGIEPASIGYVEAHGTGTPLGDPLEVAALTRAFGPGLAPGSCALGSLKTNLGHLDAAAGVAGFIKAVLALYHEMIPPSLHFRDWNPEVDFAAGPFFVNAELRTWPRDGRPRRAGASSFGMGGTNAHALLEEAPAPVPAAPPSSRAQLLTLSARSDAALDIVAARLAEQLEARPDTDVADVAFTLQLGRRAFAARRALVVSDAREAARALRGEAAQGSSRGRAGSGHRPLAFLFPGQGSLQPDMAVDLYDDDAGFRADVDGCAATLAPHLGLDLRDVLFPRGRALDEAARRLRRSALAQPALFVLEHALARLLMRLGLRPEALLGHGVGQYVAACLAGVFALDDALLLVTLRGRLMDAQPPGALLAVPLGEDEARALLGGGLSLAAVNGPLLSVIAGPEDELARVERELVARGHAPGRLHTSYAFHGASLEPALAPWHAALAGIRLQPPRLALLSNLSGDWMTASEATSPDAWTRHLHQPVRLGDNLARLLDDEARVLLEVGPGRTLSDLVRRHPRFTPERVAVATLPEPDALPAGARPALLHALGRLWTSGLEVDWAALHAGRPRRRVPLPLYPFERQRYWIEPAPGAPATARRGADEWYQVPVWQQAAPRTRPREGVGDAPWLVLTHEGDEFAARLVAHWRDAGAEVTRVVGAEIFEARAGGYALDYGRRDDYDALLRALGGVPPRVVHLLAGGASDGDPCARALQAFDSLLFVAQALAQAGARDCRLSVITRGLHVVTGAETPDPLDALVIGPCRVLPQELETLRAVHVDLLPADAGAGLEALLAELLAAEPEPTVALRGRQRFRPTFETLTPPAELPALRARGVVLITGGLGGLGLELAAHLAASAQARLVLLGREGLPPRAECDALVARARGTLSEGERRVAERVRRVRALEASGAEVLVLRADCADHAQMAAALEAVRARFGALHAVIHAAGVAGGGLAELRTRAAAHDVLRPKLHGTRVLAELLRGTPLDFVLLCSSLSAHLGGPGQIDYCAANAFLGAAAQARLFGQTPVVAVDWDAWSEVGMAARTPRPAGLTRLGEAHAAAGLSSAEGVQAFRRALALGVPRVAVARLDLAAELRRPTSVISLAQAAQPTGATHARPAHLPPYVAPRNETEAQLARLWEELLGVAPVGLFDDFNELGGHSLLAMQVVARLRRDLGVELPLRALFEAPTPAALALRVLASRLQQAAAGEGGAADVEDLLARIEQLPDGEVEQTLHAAVLHDGRAKARS